jgi:hypothetical protein
MLFTAMPIGFHYFGLPGALCGLVLSQFSGLALFVWHNVKIGLLDLRKEIIVAPAILIGMMLGRLVVLVAATY